MRRYFADKTCINLIRLVLLLVTYIPGLTMALPNLLMK